MESLRTALKMEYAVTGSIRELIAACEAEQVEKNDVFNDYHVSFVQCFEIMPILSLNSFTNSSLITLLAIS